MVYPIPLHKRVYIHPGEHRASGEPIVLSTLLGSCVSACLYDPISGICGMNHFLLANRRYARNIPLSVTEAGRYGINAMELLINAMMKLGAVKNRLKAKVFGGGAVLETISDSHFLCVGEVNQRFIREFLQTEGMEITAEDLGGTQGRVIHFHTDTYQVFRRYIPKVVTKEVEKREYGYWRKSIETPEKQEGPIVFFQ